MSMLSDYDLMTAWQSKVGYSNLEKARAVAEAVLSKFSEPDNWRLVPVEPTEEQWGGLARDIMMWLDFEHKTPRKLFAHLEMLGRDIPQWLRDEPEMQALDHVPSKGTRAAMIYRAMLEDAPVHSKTGVDTE